MRVSTSRSFSDTEGSFGLPSEERLTNTRSFHSAWPWRREHSRNEKVAIDIAKSLSFRKKFAWVFESRSQFFNDYWCSSNVNSEQCFGRILSRSRETICRDGTRSREIRLNVCKQYTCSCEFILMLITFTYKFIIVMLICYVSIKLLQQTCLLISSVVAYTELQQTHL